MKTSKRILAVRIKRMIDSDPDTSHLGEYSNCATTDYSIDRVHAEDCLSLEANHRQAVDQLERILTHVLAWRSALASNADNPEWEALDESADTLSTLQDELSECDCGEHGDYMGYHEYRYFNPSFNYVDKNGKATDTPENVRKYTRQDYERMERLNAGDWCYIGIRAEADIETTRQGGLAGPTQTISSGGLWGIESDSDKSYIAEVESEQLAELKTELLALGFSRRAIATAFKNVEEVNE